MRRFLASLLVTTAALVFAQPTGAQIVNGSFEPAVGNFSYQLLGGGSAAIPGWTTTDTGAEWFMPSAYGTVAADGQYSVDIANYTYSAGGVQQAFATTPGTSYTIPFFFGTQLGSGRDGTAQIVVSAAGQTQTYSIATGVGGILWVPETFTFTANAATSTLAFRCLQNANVHFAYVDGVGAGIATPTQGGTWGGLKALYR